MSYYYRGNLAVELDRQQEKTTAKKKRTVIIKSSIPMMEKLLYLFFVCMIVTAVGFVGYRYVQISEYNYQIQKAKRDIATLHEQNAALQLKVEQMSSRDRVVPMAESMGMVLSPGAVRVITPEGAAPQKSVAKAN
ncbi:cell division protein FtsL [Brevibacillus sp. SYSU BS000544]|uniref:cell division protein FtsL n=1 Tax=Brevibacillus sp. SYSU BS000544 TaxID=3416443 RepID=UPI003CE49843